METSPESTVLEDVNALRSLVVSVLPQLLMKLDLIGDKLTTSSLSTKTSSTTKCVEISTQTEVDEFVGGSSGAEADELLEGQDDGIRLEDLFWTEATLRGGMKVESSSEGGAAEGIQCCGDDEDAEEVMTYSLTQVLEDLDAPVSSAENYDTVLNTAEEEWTERSMAAEEYVINSHAPDVKPDLAFASNMSMNPTVAGSSCNQRPVQKNMSLLKRRQNSIRRELNQSVKKPYKCSYCSKSFSAQFGVRRHERIHTGEKPFRCSYCPKTFSHQFHLRVHERSHTHTVEKPFKCSYCSKTFTRRFNAEQHERTHTGEKPFMCSYCPKTFSHRGYIPVHERSHTGEKPFKCSNCSKTFTRRFYADQHERSFHKRDSVQV